MIDLKYGDCLELMEEIPDKSVDMVLCDLPYGTTESKWDNVIPMENYINIKGKKYTKNEYLEKCYKENINYKIALKNFEKNCNKGLWEQYKRIISKNGSIVLFASGLFTSRVISSNLEEYKYKWVWVKNNATNFVHSKNRPMTKHEDILIFSKAPMGHKSLLGDKRMIYNPQGLVPVFKKKKSGTNRFGTVAGKRKSHVLEYTQKFTNFPNDILTGFDEISSNKKLHTNEKPVPLLEYLIRTYTDEGGTVLDNCMGSGSTGEACIKTNRNFIGIEKEKKYYQISEKRIYEAIKAYK